MYPNFQTTPLRLVLVVNTFALCAAGGCIAKYDAKTVEQLRGLEKEARIVYPTYTQEAFSVARATELVDSAGNLLVRERLKWFNDETVADVKGVRDGFQRDFEERQTTGPWNPIYAQGQLNTKINLIIQAIANETRKPK